MGSGRSRRGSPRRTRDVSTRATFPRRPNTCGRKAVEVITKRDTICEGETAREMKRTNLRSRRANDGELARFYLSVGQEPRAHDRIKEVRHRATLAAFGDARRRGIYTRVRSNAMRKVKGSRGGKESVRLAGDRPTR
jgi:hypothetical protein